MNELLFVLTAVISIIFVLIMWKLGKERLYSAIVVFLILISTIGSKIVPILGHHTNTGNIFYASVFLTTYFLIERYGKKEGIRSIWIGAVCVITFSVLIQLAVKLAGSPDSAIINDAYSTAFNTIPRISFASLLAYVISQNINVYFYSYIKERWNGRHLWLRANINNALAQAADSIIFFTVGFYGSVSFSSIWDIFITGFLIKVTFMVVASLLLYLNRIEEGGENGYSSITVM